MNELALFAGAGGGILGAKLLGWRTVCAVEIETYRCERLAQRQNEGFLPPFPIWCGDIAAFDGKPWRGIADVVSGGFPCQDISAANPHAEGIAGARSGLWKEMLRVVCEVGPTCVLVENSPMLTGRGLGVVLSDLAALGYDAQWGVLGADDLGGFHKRERLFLVANLREGRLGKPEGWKVQQPRGAETECGGQDVGNTNRAGLEGHARNGNRNGGPQPAGYVTATGLQLLANGHQLNWRTEHEQQISQGERTREQSGRRGEELADPNGVRKLQPEGIKQDQRGRVGNAGSDCLWLDVEIFRDNEGRTRATKPGLCGMADGVAHRVDRISAIGDGQVPVVVAAAWQILKPESVNSIQNAEVSERGPLTDKITSGDTRASLH